MFSQLTHVGSEIFINFAHLPFHIAADITPEELFNMFFGGFGGPSMSGGNVLVILLLSVRTV